MRLVVGRREAAQSLEEVPKHRRHRPQQSQPGLPKVTELKRFVLSGEAGGPERRLRLVVCDARRALSETASVSLSRLRRETGLREVRRLVEELEKAGVCRRQGRRLVCKTAALREYCEGL